MEMGQEGKKRGATDEHGSRQKTELAAKKHKRHNKEQNR
jgi:hypothetical protein